MMLASRCRVPEWCSSLLVANILLILTHASPANAQAIEAIPTPFVQALGVSGDGTVVVGYSQNGLPLIWTVEQGVEQIALLPDTTASRNLRISEDGTTVVGTMTGDHTVRAFRWRRGIGTTQIPLPGGTAGAAVFDCSGDGSVVVGDIRATNAPPEPIVWDQQNTLRLMMLPIGAVAASVTCISRDGLRVAGQAFYTNDPPGFRAVRWNADGSNPVTTVDRSDAAAMSADGSCVAGRVNSAALRWTDAGAALLGIPESAVDVNQDGSVVVTAGVVWTLAHGSSLLTTELARRGVVLGDWSGLAITGLSSDGRVLIGLGQKGGVSRPWRVTLRCPLSVPYCAADSTCDGFLDFFDYDDFILGFESGDPAADFNGDGFLDFFDYDAFVTAFEAGC